MSTPKENVITPAERKFLGDLAGQTGSKHEGGLASGDDPGSTSGEGADDSGAGAGGGDGGGTETPEQLAARQAAEETARQNREKERKKYIDEYGLVPKEALAEARENEKKTRTELAQMREGMSKLEAQLKASGARADVKNDDPEPDKAKQPIVWMDWAVRQLAKDAQESRQWREQQRQSAEQQENLGKLSSWASNQVNSFKKTQPAYDEAYAFARAERAKDYENLGYAPDAIAAQLVQDEIGLAVMAAQRDANPGELLYKFAVGRGFKPKAAGGGKQVDTGKGDEKDLEALKKIAAGSKRAGGLKGGAAPAGDGPTPEEVANMPIGTMAQRAAFAEAWKKMGRG